MLALGEDGVRAHIRNIGLFNAKAKNVVATCRLLLERHAGEVPREREALESLPGVGRKTANVVLNTAFGVPVIAVDTHIFRVANRTRLARGKTPRAVEDRLERSTPEEFKRNAHHWLILHGRYVCTARKPACGRCVIADLCEYREQGARVGPCCTEATGTTCAGSTWTPGRRRAPGGRSSRWSAVWSRSSPSIPSITRCWSPPTRSPRSSRPSPAGPIRSCHMGLHVAIREQLATDRPSGMRELYRKLLPRFADAHRLEHALMECLAQTLWEAQRQTQGAGRNAISEAGLAYRETACAVVCRDLLLTR